MEFEAFSDGALMREWFNQDKPLFPELLERIKLTINEPDVCLLGIKVS